MAKQKQMERKFGQNVPYRILNFFFDLNQTGDKDEDGNEVEIDRQSNQYEEEEEEKRMNEL